MKNMKMKTIDMIIKLLMLHTNIIKMEEDRLIMKTFSHQLILIRKKMLCKINYPIYIYLKNVKYF